jgi:molybdate transport system substrate-binding protein
MIRHRNNPSLQKSACAWSRPFPPIIWKLWLYTIFIISLSPVAQAQQTSVGVAANFAGAMKRLKPVFEQETGHRVVTSLASSGTLYAQIHNGAPFDIFLSADRQRPQQLVADGLAINNSLFTYAEGQLALWSNNSELIDTQGAVLHEGDWVKNGIKRIALANPKTSPYGAAAMETLDALAITETTLVHLVTGQNVAHAFQFIVTGNAQMGFIAQSQILALRQGSRGSHWRIPAGLYSPIKQSAVLLKKGQHNGAALAFLSFLKSPKASAIIKASGYNAANH